MDVSVTTRDTCRICGSTDVRRFFHHENAPFTDDFVTAETAGSEFLHDVDVFWCGDCGIAQTLHDVAVGDYYRDYGYTVSASDLAGKFMDDLATAACARFGLRAGDSVIEVGSGDGAQLAAFAKHGLRVLGVEPSDSLCDASRAAGIPVAQLLFEPDSVGDLPQEFLPAQALMLSYTFDHLPDPLGFLGAAHAALDPRRGVLLIEVHDLEKIVDRREICLFEHEHSIYLTSLSFERLLNRAGFELLSLDLVPESARRGNSLLIAAAPYGTELVADPIDHGNAERLDDWDALAGFQADVTSSLDRLAAHVRATGSTAGYGAGGRGVITLAAAGLDATDVAYLCDANPSFHGLLTPKTHIPVVAPGRVFTEPTDEVLVFSFGYLREISAALEPYTRQGGKLVSMLDLLADPVPA